jgi:acyl carrier protein
MLGDDSLTLDAETQPSDVEGWDSLANVGIIFGLEEEFQVRLGDEVLAGFATLGALAEMIDAAAHAAN